MGWLRIRNTEVSILDVLELLAKGDRVSSILTRFPCLTEADIAHSAAVARAVIIGHWAFCSSPETVLTRKRFMAGSLRQSNIWTEDEDTELIKLIDSGATINDITRLLLRLRTDITDRLGRLGKRKP